MEYILSQEEHRALEQQIGANDSDAIIRKAAQSFAAFCHEIIAGRKDHIMLLCGKGNNAADGLYAVPLLHEMGYRISVGLLFAPAEMNAFARQGLESLPKEVPVFQRDNIIPALLDVRWVLDCVFGIGFHGKIPKELIPVFKEAQGVRVIACDIPSGVSCDTGEVAPHAFAAKATLSMMAYKPSCFMPASEGHFGACKATDLGIPNRLYEGKAMLADKKLYAAMVRHRPAHGHKGMFGTVQLCCGSAMMPGAGILAAKGALHSGVGLTVLASDERTRAVQQAHLVEPVWAEPDAIHPKASALVYGCGLGSCQPHLETYLASDLPLVLDADGITAVSADKKRLKRKATTVLTPHPGEFARLVGKTVDAVEKDRFQLAKTFAQKYSVILVLKGQHTLIATPSGTLYVNTSGNTALAKGGSGDVLAGVIGSLLAQGYSGTEAAVLGVYVHGKAAETLCEHASEEALLPSDLPKQIGIELGKLRMK